MTADSTSSDSSDVRSESDRSSYMAVSIWLRCAGGCV